jgi:O-antigen ligase
MVDAKPFTGVGFNGYALSYDKYNFPSEFEGERSPHSVWFGLMAETGYPGLLLFVVIWCLSIWSCLQVSALAKRDPSKTDLRFYANGLMTGLIAFGVAGTFLPAQYNEMLWHFIGLSAALHMMATSEVPVSATSVVPSIDVPPLLVRS